MPQAPSNDILDDLIADAEYGAMIHRSPATLRMWRWRGEVEKFPPEIRIGRRIYYSRAQAKAKARELAGLPPISAAPAKAA